MVNTNKSYECSECGKDLHTHKGSNMLSIYKPMGHGLTQMQPMGSQCSYECYTKSIAKRDEFLNKISKLRE